jgi:general secretion pathway protein K
MKASHRHKNHGAALLAAMLILVLVATLTAGLTWQQWRSLETERAERTRLQAGWILIGALDWARLILREDGRTAGADHLAEPWAVSLQESRLSSFLAADRNNPVLLADQEGNDAFLSGQIVDAQSKLNVRNLLDGNGISPKAQESFGKLFGLLNLSEKEFNTLLENLRFAADKDLANFSAGKASMMPEHVDQLTLLGLSKESLQTLRPYITVLPQSNTRVNLNTASAEVIAAVVPAMQLDGAQKLVQERANKHFATINDASALLPTLATDIAESGQLGVSSNFFEVFGRLRLVDGDTQIVVEERSLVYRAGLDVRALWRMRGSFPFNTQGGKNFDEFMQSNPTGR